MACDCAVMATFNRLCVAHLLIGGRDAAPADACHQDICIRPSVTGLRRMPAAERRFCISSTCVCLGIAAPLLCCSVHIRLVNMELSAINLPLSLLEAFALR